MWVSDDRVRETSATTGSGDISLAGAVSNFQAFSGSCANGDVFFYAIVNRSAAEWEVGLGTYNSGANSISRTKVISSSNADAAVNFSAGTKDVFIDFAGVQGVLPPARGLVSGVDCVVPEGASLYVSGTMEVAAGRTCEIRAGGFLEVG